MRPTTPRRRVAVPATAAAVALAVLLCAAPAMGARKLKGFLTFAVLGDWGLGPDGDFSAYYKGDDITNHDYYAQGQVAVGKAMGQICEEVGCQFVLNCGDSFYQLGINKKLGVKDPQWLTSFKNVYSAKSLQIPFLGVLGNHDYGRASPKGEHSIQPQFEFTKLDNQWFMPARNFTWKPKGFNLHLTTYDTNSYMDHYLKNTSAYYTPELVANSAPEMRKALAEWVQHQLRKAKASGGWSILLGHHPLISVPDGVYQSLNGTFAGILADPSATPHLAVNGHDHILARWRHDQVPKTEFLNIGASGIAKSEELPTADNKNYLFSSAEHGFAIVRLGKNYGRVSIYGVANTTVNGPKYTFKPAQRLYSYVISKN